MKNILMSSLLLAIGVVFLQTSFNLTSAQTTPSPSPSPKKVSFRTCEPKTPCAKLGDSCICKKNSKTGTCSSIDEKIICTVKEVKP